MIFQAGNVRGSASLFNLKNDYGRQWDPNPCTKEEGAHVTLPFCFEFYLNVTLSVHVQLMLTNICVAQFPENFCNTLVRLGGEGRSFSSRLVFFFSKYFIDQISCAVLLIFISNFDLDTFGFSYLLIYFFV